MVRRTKSMQQPYIGNVPEIRPLRCRSPSPSFSGNPPQDSVPEPFRNHPILPLLRRFLPSKVLHAHTITTGLIGDPFAASRLLAVCFQSKTLNPRYIRHVFESIPSRDVYTWNTLIIGLAERESPCSGIECFFRMLSEGFPPNGQTFALAVKACVMAEGDAWLGRKMHGQVVKQGWGELLVVKNSLIKLYCNMGCLPEARILFDQTRNLDLISWNSMISGYGKQGNVRSARELFNGMPERSLVSWSAMVDGYVRSGGYWEALKLFDEMRGCGVEPDVVILVSALKACANLGAIDEGKEIHGYIEQRELMRDRNVILGTALVDMYAKCGCIDMALEVFHGINERDVILWNSMVCGLALNGHGEEAVNLFCRMRESGMSPNESTFIAALSGCTHAGLVHEGREIFCSMKRDYGIEPRREHYGCLADLLGRAGLLAEALEVLRTMPMEPGASNWGALLAACKMYNNMEVGEEVGKRLIALEPHEGKRYVQLFNAYVDDQRWEDAVEIRKRMEEMTVKKDSGHSSVR